MDGPGVEPAGGARDPADEKSASSPTSEDYEDVQRIRTLPKEVGVLLIVAGVGGILLPGPVGTPFLILGGVVLWPKAFERVETYVENRFPKLHHQSLRQIKRFLADLDARYPLPK